MKISVRALLLSTAAIALLLAFALEYGQMVRADGGGIQLICVISIPKAIEAIDFVPIHNSQSYENVVNAFSTGNQLEILQAVGPTEVKSLVPNGTDSKISIRQQWSFSEMGFTKRRPHYTQTYRHVVLNLVSTDGSTKQHVIALPEYCETTTVDLSRDLEN